MTEIVLYHHVQGLTEGVRLFAESLRKAGHTVHTPELFDGRTFATIEEGMAFAREAGFGTLAARGVAAAEGIGDGVVYAGFSFGVVPAQRDAALGQPGRQRRADASSADDLHRVEHLAPVPCGYRAAPSVARRPYSRPCGSQWVG